MKVYIARQPILNADRTVHGYELLYRDSAANFFSGNVDNSKATFTVVSEIINTFGLHNLLHGKYAFINFSESLLMEDVIEILDPTEFVIEILECVQESDEILQKIYTLKEQGFIIALDDYTGKRDIEQAALIAAADILKVDFMQLSMEECIAIANRYRGNKILLAEKVEREEDYHQAKACGYTLFQGYYFAKPTVFAKTTTQIMSSTTMRILQELNSTAPDFNYLTELVQNDVVLSYKLMQRINTLEFYRGYRVYTLRQALVRLGLREIYRWVMLLLMRSSLAEECDEIVRIALLRGVFAEKIAMVICPQYYEDAFAAGMFSMIDSVVDEQLPLILDELHLPPSVNDALLGADNPIGRILHFVISYENGDWASVEPFISANHLNADFILNSYWEAVQYADLAFDNK